MFIERLPHYKVLDQKELGKYRGNWFKKIANSEYSGMG